MRRSLFHPAPFAFGFFCYMAAGLSASPAGLSEASRLFTHDAILDLGTPQLLSGSTDQSVIPALRAQIEQAERISRTGTLSWESDNLAQLTDRLVSIDGAVKIQTIELEEERKLAVKTFAEIFATDNRTTLISMRD